MRAKCTRCVAVLLLFLACDVTWSQAKRSVPPVQTIAEGMVWRQSPNTDGHGINQTPWKEITIANIFGFKKRPVIGDPVTVITLDSDIPAMSVGILRAQQPTKDPCTERPADYWEVELEPLKVQKFFEAPSPSNRSAAYPFDVVIIYPAVKAARQIRKNELKPQMLPKGAFIDTVKAAIDLNNDGKPDVVILEYCCSDTRKPAEGCDYTCSKTFKKVKNTWKLIDTSAPC